MFFCSICLETYKNIETAMRCCAIDLSKENEKEEDECCGS